MSEMKWKCCNDWETELPKVNAPIILQSARSGGLYQYDGKAFRYCPWCGAQLPKPNYSTTKEGGR